MHFFYFAILTCIVVHLDRCGTQEFVTINGQATSISASFSGVWVTNTNRATTESNVFYLTGSYGNPTLTTNVWTDVDGYFEQVAAGQDIVVATDKDGNVFYRDGISETNPTGNDWKPLKGGGKCVQVDIYTTNDLWCLRDIGEHADLSSSIFRYDWSSKQWVQVNGGFSVISTGPAGLWGVNPRYEPIYRVGTKGASDQSGSGWIAFFNAVERKLVSLSVGDNIVVGISEDNQVWISPGIPEVEPEAPCQW